MINNTFADFFFGSCIYSFTTVSIIVSSYLLFLKSQIRMWYAAEPIIITSIAELSVDIFKLSSPSSYNYPIDIFTCCMTIPKLVIYCTQFDSIHSLRIIEKSYRTGDNTSLWIQDIFSFCLYLLLEGFKFGFGTYR